MPDDKHNPIMPVKITGNNAFVELPRSVLTNLLSAPKILSGRPKGKSTGCTKSYTLGARHTAGC